MHLLDEHGRAGVERLADDRAHGQRRRAADRVERPQAEHRDVQDDQALGAEIRQPAQAFERQLDLPRAPCQRDPQRRVRGPADDAVRLEAVPGLEPHHAVHDRTVVGCALRGGRGVRRQVAEADEPMLQRLEARVRLEA